MVKYLVSDTITEFRSYWVEADSENEAMDIVDKYATDAVDQLPDELEFDDRGITDRFQQIEGTK